MALKYFFIFFCFFYSYSNFSGAEENKTNQNINNQNNINEQNKLVKHGDKPAEFPDFPEDDKTSYKMLFDNGFANVVSEGFEGGKKWDIFVNQDISNEINRRYMTGNYEEINEMDVIEAEKKTIFDNKKTSEEDLKTYRTRILAYLTEEQMILPDVFLNSEDGFYLNAVLNSMKQ